MQNRNLVGFFFINTERELFSKAKKLSYPIKSADYSFLTHISFIDCSEIKTINAKYILHKIEKQEVEIRGEIKDNDLNTMLNTLRDSDVFSEEEKDLYLR